MSTKLLTGRRLTLMFVSALAVASMAVTLAISNASGHAADGTACAS